ncbi:MAG: hypothetical protein J6X60_09630 [Ruminiclostridium sp.]|nr:hypothetical protein [Ruminiclostridium sp.]
MKKYVGKITAAVMITSLMLAGCDIGGALPAATSPVTETSAQSSDTTVPVTEPVSVVSQAPEKKATITPFKDTPFGVFDGVPDDVTDSSNLTEDGKILLLSNRSIYQDAGACLFDLNTGEHKECTITADDTEYYYFRPFISGGSPVIYNSCDGKLNIYDDELELKSSLTIGTGKYSNAVVYDEDTIVVCEMDSDTVYFVDIKAGNGTVKELKAQLPENCTLSALYGVVGEDDDLLVEYMNTDPEEYMTRFAIIDSVTGESIPLAEKGTVYYDNSGRNILRTDYYNHTLELFDSRYPDTLKVIYLSEAENIAKSFTGDYIFTYNFRNEGENVYLTRYDCATGSPDARVSMGYDPDDYPVFSQFYTVGDNIVFLGRLRGIGGLFLWKPEKIESERSYGILTERTYTEENKHLAEKIETDYSVKVNYGKDGVKFFDGYAVVTEEDEALIHTALTSLDSFFGKLPSGFMEELCSLSQNYDKTEIFLTGKIIPDTFASQSISDAAAFVGIYGDTQNMVIDITGYNLETTIAHEFMHVIENAIFGHGYTDDDLERFGRWSMLNPDDFTYYFSYTDSDGRTLGYNASEYNGSYYFEGGSLQIDDVYFVDGYSMTYPAEDRARIFETLASNTPESLPAYFRGKGIQLKAAYLMDCIAEAFETVPDDTYLFGSGMIDPAYTLEYFRENYDLESYWDEHAVG